MKILISVLDYVCDVSDFNVVLVLVMIPSMIIGFGRKSFELRKIKKSLTLNIINCINK